MKPQKVTEAGYRLYGGAELRRLQNILLFRELQFPLKEIKEILDSTNFNPQEAIAQQIELLELQYKHIGELISFAREIQNKGVKTVNFDVFNKTELEQYKEEVRERWGNTHAFKEYEQRNASKIEFSNEFMSLFSEFGALKSKDPAEKCVQDKVRALQSFITEKFYTCTDEILMGLGEMYVSDERFKQNIDSAGGEGTAEFVKQAISCYCNK